MLGLRALARLFHRRPAGPAVPSPRLAEVIPLALAEKAMADGCPTPDQELMLMAAGSPAHLARRHWTLCRASRSSASRLGPL
ncbi:hypothetical protein [Kutzneria buriramensis]|uniref:Uncharacterized protein n=1 Tax=Kutzneria buriramensis TaxID=1045776 RepID=A0A3E0GZH3_9PSEU|nr:hypothetical protein [Kutzneria buriramensis]REH35257.1 hypothetical protein BCF44_118117 [Kutzneria buriramensis]